MSSPCTGWGNVSDTFVLRRAHQQLLHVWLEDKLCSMCAYCDSLNIIGVVLFCFATSLVTPASSWCRWQIAWQILTGQPQIDYLLEQLNRYGQNMIPK